MVIKSQSSEVVALILSGVAKSLEAHTISRKKAYSTILAILINDGFLKQENGKLEVVK